MAEPCDEASESCHDSQEWNRKDKAHMSLVA